MAYVITQGCCNDGSFVPACPVPCTLPWGSNVTHTEQL